MKPLGMTTLAGLVLVVAAAPVAAYALTAGSDGPTPPAPAATHAHPTPTAPDDGPDHATGSERAAEASAPGRAHAEAMKAWAHCVADAASGPKVEGAPIPPKLACGDKPTAPGRAKHAPDGDTAAAPGKSGDHRHDGGHGR
jgi:hypothetical protein